MKTIFALTVFTAGIYITFAAVANDPNDPSAHLKVMAKCKEAHKVDDDTFNGILKAHKVPESEEGKCMIVCILKEEGLFHDGKFDLDAMKKAGAIKWKDAAMVEKINKVVKECVEGASPDDKECDMVAKVMTCYIDKSIKEGISHPKID